MSLRSLACSAVLLTSLPCAFAQKTSPATVAGSVRAESVQSLSASLQELVQRASSAVVQVNCSGYTIVEQGSSGAGTGTGVFAGQRSTGAGVLLSADGFIVTNAHVVQGAHRIRVRLNGLKNAQGIPYGDLRARLVGVDALTDLALLKVDATSLPFLKLADSGDLQQGQLVMAFGSPLGLENSVSLGVISSTARQVSLDDPRVFLQTDAAINPGNSGGPLVDAQGQVVGINTFILSQSGGSEGIGFAIPSNVVRNITTQLQKEGHVHRGQIGVYARAITPSLAQGLKLPQMSGVVLEDVFPGGPAYKAGLKVGDVVLSVAGRPVMTIPRFAVSLYRFQIGEAAPIEVLRGKERLTFQVPVVEATNDPERFADIAQKANIIAPLGIVGLTLDQQLLQNLPELRVNTGVLVAADTTGAAYSGDPLKTGDVIHQLNTTPIQSIDDLKRALTTVQDDQSIVLQVERDGKYSFIVQDPE